MDLSKFLFSGKGRVSRKEMWIFSLALFGIGIVAVMLDTTFFGTSLDADDNGPINAVVSFASIWPAIAVSVKRFHDRGMSGWWVLWFILITVAAAIPGGAIVIAQGSGANLGGVLMLLGIAIPQIWQFVILMVLPGKPGPNQYGPNPLDPAGSDLEETFA